jgi:GNAT superfamily N-acetyltransferase
MEFQPVTRERWADLRALFEAAEPAAIGNPGKCWCMEWRLPREQWRAQVGEANREALRRLAESDEVPGILAYEAGRAVGWCSVSPRKDMAGLREAGTFDDFDAADVWAIVCFYLVPEVRGRGVMAQLLQAAVTYAADRGARVIDAYPVDPAADTLDKTGFMGTIGTFERAGFVRSPEAGQLNVEGYTDGNRVVRYFAGHAG